VGLLLAANTSTGAGGGPTAWQQGRCDDQGQRRGRARRERSADRAVIPACTALPDSSADGMVGVRPAHASRRACGPASL